ncbi:MAG: PspC domain-containing protein [bacterium]
MAEKKKEQKNQESKSAVEKPAAQEESPRRIYRSLDERMLAGVCGGIAEYFNFDVLIIRVIWVVSIFTGGLGIIAYILSWIVIPENPSPKSVVKKSESKSSNSNLMWGLLLIVVGCMFLFQHLDWFDIYPIHFRWHWRPWWFGNFGFGLLLPVLLIILGVIYLIKVSKKETTTAQKQSQKKSGGYQLDKKLTRSVCDKMIGGVCGGVAAYFNFDPSLVRIGWVLLTIASGGFLGIVAYIVMLIVVPEETSTEVSESSPKSAATKTQKK